MPTADRGKLPVINAFVRSESPAILADSAPKPKISAKASRRFVWNSPFLVGDCTMDAGASLTLTDDWKATFDATVHSSDTNDQFKVFFQFRASNGSVLYRLPAIQPPFNDVWFYKDIPNSDTVYTWHFAFDYVAGTLFYVASVVMYGNC